MALTKPNPDTNTTPATAAAAAVNAVGSFESMEETVSTKPAANDAAPSPSTPAPAAAAAAPAAEVPVTQAKGAVATSNGEASKFADEVAAMKGGADFSYGNYPVFKGINGEIKGTGDTKVSLGRWAKVTMLAWDDRTQVSPGSDNDSAKLCVAYSKDHVTLDSVIGVDKYGSWVGKKVADYVEFLKQNDWLKASASRFIDVAVVVHDADTTAGKEMAGEIICVSLSKSSMPSFQQYQEKLNMKAKAVARGIPGVAIPDDPFTFYMIREAASKDGKDWTKIKVSDKLKLD